MTTVVKKIKLDFSKVEERSGWNTRQMPEGLHAMKVVSVEDKEANDGTDMLVFALVPESSKYKTRRFPFYCKLQENQYFKIRDLLVAAGVKVPKSVMTVDPNKVIGKVVAVEVVDATGAYDGRSEANGVYPLAALDGDDDTESDDEYDEEEEDDDEEYEDNESEDDEGDSDDEDEEYEDEDDEDDLDDEDLEDEDEDDDEEYEDDEDEDEEPEPAPRKRAPAKKAPAKSPAKKPAAKTAARKAPAKAAPARRVVKRR